MVISTCGSTHNTQNDNSHNVDKLCTLKRHQTYTLITGSNCPLYLSQIIAFFVLRNITDTARRVRNYTLEFIGIVALEVGVMAPSASIIMHCQEGSV